MNLLFLTLMLLGVALSHDTQTVLSSPSTEGVAIASSEPSVSKVLRVTRHGTTAGFYSMYPSEWAAYNLPDPNMEDELELSALGMGQCWSSGANLAKTYPELAQEAVRTSSFEMNIGPKKKTEVCGTQFLYGLIGKATYIGSYSDPVVAEAFADAGNCFQCSADSAFPFELSQSLGPETNDLDFSELMIIHPESFLDLDEFCPKAFVFYQGSYEFDIPQEDIDYLTELSGISADDEHYMSMVSSIPNTYSKHLMHHLPALDVSQKLTDIVTGIMNGTQKMPFLKYISGINSNNWAVVAVYARSLMEDMLSKIENDQKLIVYTTHNNNAISLLLLLQGLPDENYEDYKMNLSSHFDLAVYEYADSGEKYVNFLVNGDLKLIKGCDANCPFAQFKELMSSFIELGGDLSVFCNY